MATDDPCSPAVIEDREALAASVIPLAYHLARKLADRYSRNMPPNFRRELLRLELVAEAMVGIARALNTYDPSKSAFTTYSALWMNSYMDTYISTHVSGPKLFAWLDAPPSRSADGGDGSLSDDFYQGRERAAPESARNHHRPGECPLRLALSRHLSPTDAAIVRELYLAGRSVRDVASEMGRSHGTVQQRAERAIVKLHLALRGREQELTELIAGRRAGGVREYKESPLAVVLKKAGGIKSKTRRRRRTPS